MAAVLKPREKEAHALLSPSSAHRWLRCTPSAVAEAEAGDDGGSKWALEGSLAHAVCAYLLDEALKRDTDGRRAEMFALEDEYGQPVPKEMQEHCKGYRDYVLGIFEKLREEDRDTEIYIEAPLDLSGWAPQSFGTADALIVNDHTLYIIDFKYGQGVRVEAKGNAQMRLYALGAMDEFGISRDIEEVYTTIYQPRLNAVSTETLTDAELWEFGLEIVRPMGEVAFRGLGGRVPGDHCRFCKAAKVCPTLDIYAAAADSIETVGRTDPKRLGEVCLPMVPAIEKWLETVRSAAMAAMMSGADVPGWKLVRKRTLKRISDVAGAVEALNGLGYADDDIFKEPQLKSLGDLEKLVGKKELNEALKEFITKPEGEPTIAPASDRRTAITPASAFDNIDIS